MQHPDPDARRRVGQRSSSRGNSFEHPHLALWLAELGPEDTLELDGPDDGEVVRAGGHRTVKQIKSGATSGAVRQVRKVVESGEARFADGSADSFILITEEKLTARSEAVVHDAQSRWGSRFKHDRVATSRDVRNRVRDVLAERLFSGRVPDLAQFAAVPELEHMVDSLQAYVDRITFPDDPGGSVTITGADVDQQIGLSHMLAVWRSRLSGDRLAPWSDWVSEIERRHDDHARSWQQALTAPWGVRTIAEERLLDCLEGWLAGEAAATVQLVFGRSGTGKTWVLARTAQAFADRCDVYVIHDRHSLSSPDLPALAAASQPRQVVVVVDDLRQEDVEVALRRSLGAPGLMVLAAAGGVRRGGEVALSLPRDIEDLVEDLGDQLRRHPLSEPAAAEDRKALTEALGRPVVSTALDKKLARSNLRQAAAMLGADVPRTSPTRLAALWRGQDTAVWAAPAICASAVGVRVPRRLLIRHGRVRGAAADVSAAVDQLFLTRHTDDGGLVCFEEQACGAALAELTKRFGGDEMREARRTELARLLHGVDPASARERAFARQVLRAVPAADLRALIARAGPQLAEIAERDGNADIAYTWLRVLSEAPEVASAALARAARTARPPQDAADVMVLSAALGREAAAEAVLDALPTGAWSAQPWAAAFKTIRGLPPRTARRVARIALIALERGAIDIDSIIEDGGAASNFLEAVIESGRPTLRISVRATLEQRLRSTLPPIGLTTPFLELAERCVMQVRSGLAVELALGAVGDRDHAALHAEGVARFAEIVAMERQNDFLGCSLKTTLEVARSLQTPTTLTRAAAVWVPHAARARRWHRAELGRYDELLACAVDVEAAGAGHVAAGLVHAAAQGIAASRTPTPAGAADLLVHFRRRRPDIRSAQAFITLSSWLTGAEDDAVALSASWLLRRLAVGPLDAARSSGDILCRRIRRWAGLDWTPRTPVPVAHVFETTAEELLNSYLSVVRGSERAGGVPAGVLMNLARRGDAASGTIVFSELFRRGGDPPHRTLRAALAAADRGAGETHPEVVARRIAFEARFGEVAEAARLVRVMCELQRRQQLGAHLFTAHRALAAMSTRLDGIPGEMLQLACSLLFIGSLERPGTSAAVVHPRAYRER